MKKPFFIFIYICFIVVVVPSLLTINMYKDYFLDKPKYYKNQKENKKEPYIKVYNTNNNSVDNMKIENYLYNVVASEMPANFNFEALKSQAIAARTFVFYKIENGGFNIPNHKGAVVCTDYKHCQAYLTDEQLEKAHGSKWMKELWPKVKKAVDDTKGIVITYNGAIIQPLYHSTSGGKTENSEEVFSSQLPYLRSVSSPYEEGAPKLVSSVEINKLEFMNKIKSKYKNMTLSENIQQDIHILSRTQGGSVKQIKFGNEVLSGRDVRSVFNLNSSDFDIKFVEGKVDITTKGYGHGVGMSQWGANGMANRGSNYEEILKHYFTGVNLEKRY